MVLGFAAVSSSVDGDRYCRVSKINSSTAEPHLVRLHGVHHRHNANATERKGGEKRGEARGERREERRGGESRGGESRGEQKTSASQEELQYVARYLTRRRSRDRRFCSSSVPRSRQGARTISLHHKHPAPNLTVRSGKTRAALWGRPWLVSGCS